MIDPQPGGLRAHRSQFALLVLTNALVGGMIGLERTLLPIIAAREFHLAATALAFSFIATFGATKACMNLVAGALADRVGRRRVLIAGWAIAAPVPFMLGWGGWSAIVAANALLGASQGLTWSMTVTMKLDLARPDERGLAAGLNEFAGYGGAGLTALATGFIAARAGLRPEPFYLGIAYVAAGLLLSTLAIGDTAPQRHVEARVAPPTARDRRGARRAFAGAAQAGFATNLNDAVSWGVLPLLFSAQGLGLPVIGEIKAVYLATWSVGQLVTGPLSDRLGRHALIVSGMIVQALGHALIAAAILSPGVSGFTGALLLGAGTAMVYPLLLASVADDAPPVRRARTLGWYRFWRDLGYSAGALLAGAAAVRVGLRWTVAGTAAITLLSGIAAALLRRRR